MDGGLPARAAIGQGALAPAVTYPDIAVGARKDARATAPIAKPGTFRKRVFDACAGAAALGFLIPLLSVIWVAVRLTSPGPGLFWTRRVGLGGQLFWMP